MQQSIFTRIINGEIPAFKIYEDEKTLAFLDIHPVQPGHVLVVSKQQIDHFEDLPDELYQAVWATAKKVALRQREVLKRQRIGVSVIGLDVPHAHIHLIPFDTVEQYHTVADMAAEPDATALADMQAKLSLKE